MESQERREVREIVLGKQRSGGLVILYSILTLGIYFLWWHYRVNKEILQHDSNQHFSPAWATVAMFVPIANLVSVHNTAHRIRKMQQACGDVNTINPVTALILAMLLMIGYILMIQTNLNDHWEMHARGRKQ